MREHKELKIIGIGVEDAEPNIRRFALENAMPWPVGMDEDEKISSLYGITFGSGVVFIDKSGIVRESFLMGVTEKQFFEALKKIVE